MTSNKTILITGTHHTPAIELINQLREDNSTNWDIHYIGQISQSDTHIQETLLPLLKKNFHHLESGKYDRRWLPNTIRGIPKTVMAFFRAYQILSKVKPDIVVSFGSFISVPVIIAAYLYHIPSITHEQTSTLSLSTRLNRFFVNKVALSFNTPHLHPKNIVTGNLLRRDIFKLNSTKFAKLQSKLNKYPLIYITGGHQGSLFFNQIIEKIISQLTENYTVIHQTGNRYQNHLPVQKNYYSFPYINHQDIGWVLNHAFCIVSRSGANICQEIVALNKASILIPLPVSQQDEQFLNAQWVKQQIPSHTIISLQKDTTPDTLLQHIHHLSQLPPLPPNRKPVYNLALLHLIHEIID